jgi:hypothetical protein
MHQARLIHRSAENCLTVRHELSIAVFCIGTNGEGRRLSSFKLLRELFGIKHFADITGGIKERFLLRYS